MRIRHSFLTPMVLAGLSGAGLFALVACNEKTEKKPLSGAELFVQTCSTPGKLDANCKNTEAIERTFGFNLMNEINGQHQKMRKTASAIASGGMTDDQYKSCLADKSCAEVPMLDEKKGDETPHAKEISRAFWALAEGNTLTLGICKQMPVCAVALDNGVIMAKKNKIVPAKAGKS